MLLATRESARWRRRGLAALALLGASYAIYDWREYAHGGSAVGTAYGVLGVLSILALLYFGVRKRSYRSRWGTLEGWLQCHVYLGLLSAFVILFHTGFRFQDRMAVAAFAVLLLVVGSGLVGAVLYTTVPRLLSGVESNLSAAQISEQLNQLARSMTRLASGRSPAFQQVCSGLLAESAPERLAGWKILLAKGSRRRELGEGAPWAAQLARVARAEEEELRQLLVLARQHRELRERLVAQQRYRNLLDVWLYLHVPLSVVLVVLVAAHLVAVFYYSGI